MGLKSEDKKMVKTVLDIGCGFKAKGTVNVDLFTEPSLHRGGPENKKECGALDVHSFKNFVKADACHLPFKNDSFDLVYSDQVIEHSGINPELFIKEAVRVCRKKIIIQCPHRFEYWFGAKQNREVHENYLNKRWLFASFRKLGMKSPSVQYTEYFFLPHECLPILRIPTQMKAVAWKR
jgi:SAM-dependent methyltransferase